MEHVIIDGFHLRIQTAEFWDGCWRRNGGGKWAYEEWEMGRPGQGGGVFNLCSM